MNELAEKLIKNHKQPTNKLNISGLKLPEFTGSEEQKNRVEVALNTMRDVLSAERVERRCGRSKCIWLENEALVRVIKIVGALLQNYGYQNKDGIFLTPEEALFLLEMNKIELFWNDVSLSIQHAYTLILKDEDSLNAYRVYRSLKLIGYKLQKHENSQKRQLEENEQPECKKKCLERNQNSSNQNQNVERVFWDYKVRFPESTKKDGSCFYLYVNKSDTLDDCLGNTDGDGPVITAIKSRDDVAFYRFASIDLPVL